ncbi:MAG: hypothetical protein LUD39_01840, partial [Opitutae bacterium]|nr:hypothetical protein [Opitutae bacterium]
MKNAKFLLSTLFAAAALTAVNAMADGYTESTTVEITENTTYDSVGISGTSTAVTFTLPEGVSDDIKISTGTLTLGDGTELKITGETLDFSATLSNLSAGNITGDGKFETIVATTTADAGKTLTISVGTAEILALLNTGAGDVEISSTNTDITKIDNSGGEITINSSTVKITKITNTGGNISIIAASGSDSGDDFHSRDETTGVELETFESADITTTDGSITINFTDGSVKASNIESTGAGDIVIKAGTVVLSTVTSSGSGDISISASTKATITDMYSAGGDIDVSGTAEISNIYVSGNYETSDGDVRVGAVRINSGANVTVGNFTDTSYSANLQVAGSMEVSGSMTFSSSKTSEITVSDGGSLTVATFTDTGSGAISFDVAAGGSLEITTLNLGDPSVPDTSSNESITFSGAGTYTIGTISANSLNSNNPRTLTVDVGTTLNVGTLAISSKLTTLAIGGTINVVADETSGSTGAITFGTSYSIDITNSGESAGKLTASSL